MSVKVRLPVPLRDATGGKDEICVEVGTEKRVIDVLKEIDYRYPGFNKKDGMNRVYKDDGKINRFVIVFVNDEDVRFLNQEDTIIKDGDEISIIPAIAGGK